MSIKVRLAVMNFLQFFIWGAWLISIGRYLGANLGFTGAQIGAVFSTLGIASLFMPALFGIIADKWISAQRVLGFCHLAGAAALVWASTIKDPSVFFWAMLVNSMFYMPTIALNNTVSYIVLEQKGYQVVDAFPPIRTLGTVGFIVAMWIVDLTGWKDTNMQLIFSAVSSCVLGLYALTLPNCPPAGSKKSSNWITALGLNAFVLFKDRKMLFFFLFAMFLGGALQISNAFGGSFLGSFGGSYPDSFVVKHEILTLSISQISESLFILAIPFFLHRFGIKKVMLISIFAWVLRFGFFGIGDPGTGLIFLILSMVIYGMAFDFFNVSGSLFVEKEAPAAIRASAQGLFMFMTNGVGAMIGGYASGLVVDHFTTTEIANGASIRVTDWSSAWLCFAGYALVLGIIFPLLFKYKHVPDHKPRVSH